MVKTNTLLAACFFYNKPPSTLIGNNWFDLKYVHQHCSTSKRHGTNKRSCNEGHWVSSIASVSVREALRARTERVALTGCLLSLALFVMLETLHLRARERRIPQLKSFYTGLFWRVGFYQTTLLLSRFDPSAFENTYEHVPIAMHSIRMSFYSVTFQDT